MMIDEHRQILVMSELRRPFMKAKLFTHIGLATGLLLAAGTELGAGASAAIHPSFTPDPAFSTPPSSFKMPSEKLNVLFIAVDDLRLQLGCYGNKQVISPNIDSIARDGLLFENAYCQQALCAPSRASLLSGLRPDSTRIYNLETPLRSVLPNLVTLPQLFKENGYETVSIGKIYHHPQDDFPQGWSTKPYRNGSGYASPEELEIIKAKLAFNSDGNPIGHPYEAADVPDNTYAEGRNTDFALGEIQRLQKTGRPFFLAMGFNKPHLPFIAPKKYWDLYDPNKLPLAPNPYPPENVTPYSLTDFGELRGYYEMPKKGAVPDVIARKLVHGYHACVSYTDAQIGRILAELDRLGLREKTIVILWGDHGWKLGEHGSWCKHTNFENDTHAPLLISVPGMKNAKMRTRALVEFVDIYPSLAELNRLPLPAHLEGKSFVPLLQQPGRSWKKAAFSQYPRGTIMGYTMKTRDFRYTEWRNIKSDAVMAQELYDHRKDPMENRNVAGLPEYAGTVMELGQQMKAGWRAALP
jgi:iduronate 2-sulfatase